MGLLGLLVLGGLGWLLLTGRLARPTSGQIAALIAALVGGAIAARGRPLVGGIMAAGGLVWLSRKPSSPKQARATEAPLPDARMRECFDLLGLSPDADRAAVIDAHRRLIARNHPDAGGTDMLARTINGARDYLLERLPK